jgi:hypothetical protein
MTLLYNRSAFTPRLERHFYNCLPCGRIFAMHWEPFVIAFLYLCLLSLCCSSSLKLHCTPSLFCEKLGVKEGELWFLVLLGQISLYLQLLRCLASSDKSGVVRFCSVMVEMSSQLGLYGPGLGRAGRSLCYSHVHHIKNLHF